MKKSIGLMIVFTLYFSGCVSLDKGNFGHFKRSLNHKTYGYQVKEDTTTMAPTKMIEVFEVKDGDCSSNSGWSDCDNDRERSELSGTKDNYPGNEYWYGWSIYFPQNYINIYPTKTALGQFHQKSSHPIWMFQNFSGGYHLDQQVHGSTEKYYKLLNEKELRKKWHKVELHVRWSKKSDGFFRVWINGVQKVNYSGQTMDASQAYFKYGIYRSFLSRYISKKKWDVLGNLPPDSPKEAYQIEDPKIPTQIVYYSNVKRANSREKLLPQKD